MLFLKIIQTSHFLLEFGHELMVCPSPSVVCNTMTIQRLRSVLLSKVLAPWMWDSRVHQGPGPSRDAKSGAKKKREAWRQKLWRQNDEESKVQMDLIICCPHRLSFMEPANRARWLPKWTCMSVCMCVSTLASLGNDLSSLFNFSYSVTNVRYL